MAASALLSGCGGSTERNEAGAEGGTAGQGGQTASAGSAGIPSAGGSGSVAGSSATLGAGFPTCPRYDEPQICSAEGAECLDISPCESGGCRRIRSICTSGFWAPDGGTACGFACSDGAAPTTCEIDELAGVFQASFIQQAGDCELDYEPSGPVPLEEGKVAFETERCSLELEFSSADRCKLTYSVLCADEAGSALWTYWLQQIDEDGSALQGTVELVMTLDGSTCMNTYALRFDKRP